jgi:imidazolonepropionase-like amidohydrolase
MQPSMPMKTPRPMLVATLAVLTLAAAPALAARSARPPASFAIDHVTLIDGTGKAPRPDSTVLVVAGKIQAIGAAGMRLPRRTQRVEGRGRYLIPGLMDLHIHRFGGGNQNSGSKPLIDKT